MAQQCKPAVFGLMLTIAATAAACPAGWTPSPNASWANRCFGVPADRSSSLRSCVELCGAEGGVPACIGSEEENAFAAELIGNDTAWLGLYQNDTSGGDDEGWGRCAASEAPSFSSWRAGQPSEILLSAGADCAVMVGRDDDCHVKLGSSFVARRHLKIQQRGNQFFVENLKV